MYSLLSLIFSLQQNWKREQKRFFLKVRVVGWGAGYRDGTMYTQMNKKTIKNSKNNKFKLLSNYISLLNSKD
jgi:CRISPR/Cas system CSM-associated protein Csm5 (group 7 of RAMP superfamily)